MAISSSLQRPGSRDVPARTLQEAQPQTQIEDRVMGMAPAPPLARGRSMVFQRSIMQERHAVLFRSFWCWLVFIGWRSFLSGVALGLVHVRVLDLALEKLPARITAITVYGIDLMLTGMQRASIEPLPSGGELRRAFGLLQVDPLALPLISR